MSKIADGGPAYPAKSFTKDGDEIICTGMTLRDYFAALAMNGTIIAAAGARSIGTAEWAYEIADAMIEARAK